MHGQVYASRGLVEVPGDLNMDMILSCAGLRTCLLYAERVDGNLTKTHALGSLCRFEYSIMPSHFNLTKTISALI